MTNKVELETPTFQNETTIKTFNNNNLIKRNHLSVTPSPGNEVKTLTAVASQSQLLQNKMVVFENELHSIAKDL